MGVRCHSRFVMLLVLIICLLRATSGEENVPGIDDRTNHFALPRDNTRALEETENLEEAEAGATDIKHHPAYQSKTYSYYRPNSYNGNDPYPDKYYEEPYDYDYADYDYDDHDYHYKDDYYTGPAKKPYKGNRGYYKNGNRGYYKNGNRGYYKNGNRGYYKNGNRGYNSYGNRGYYNDDYRDDRYYSSYYSNGYQSNGPYYPRDRYPSKLRGPSQYDRPSKPSSYGHYNYRYPAYSSPGYKRSTYYGVGSSKGSKSSKGSGDRGGYYGYSYYGGGGRGGFRS